MQILSWQFIHLVLSIIFATFIFMLLKLNFFKKYKKLRAVLIILIGLLFINSFGAFLIITIHYLTVR